MFSGLNPGLASWANFSRPFGTFCDDQDFEAELRSRDAAKATVRNKIDRQADQRLGTSRALSEENARPLVTYRAGHRRGHWFWNFHRDRHRDRGREIRHLLDSEHPITRLPCKPPCLDGPPG